MGKKDEALVLSKQLRISLFNKDKDVSSLLLECKTVCRYLEILDKNMWLVYELNGYSPFTKICSQMKLKKLFMNYRFVNFTFFRIDNQPVILDNDISQILFIHPVIVGCVGLENITKLTITSSDYINQYNDLV